MEVDTSVMIILVMSWDTSTTAQGLRLELALVFPGEEGMVQQSSISISLSFENQGINPVGGHTQVPRTYTNK